MPVFEQGYRPYHGEFSRRSSILAMAWQNFRPRLRWWVWLLAAVLLFYPHLVWAVSIFITNMVAGGAGGGVSATAASMLGDGAGWTAYGFGVDPNPALVGKALSGQSLWLFWQILEHAAVANIVLPAVAAGGVLASDRVSGATQIYFARPVTRLEYLLSKILCTSAFSFMVTAVPLLLLWAECAAFNPDATFILNTWMAPFAIVGASALYALWASSIVLALSASLRRPVIVSVCAVFVPLLSMGISGAIVETTQNKMWRLIDPTYAMGGLTAPMFGGELPEWLATPWLLVPSVVLPAALFAFVWWRIRAVEVVT